MHISEEAASSCMVSPDPMCSGLPHVVHSRAQASICHDPDVVQYRMMTNLRGCRYHFVTTTCAIIGGVFTVAGIVDGLVHTGARLAKKVELGKHT